ITMYWLAGLVVLQLALEEAVCAFGPGMPPRPRKLSALLALGLLAGLSVALCLAAWQVWAWILPIAAYRFINLLRVYVARLPAPRLRTVTTGAFNWLIAAQVATVALAW